MLFRLTVRLAAILLIAGLMFGCGSAKAPQIGSVTLTDQVDDTTKAAKSSLTKFPQGTREMYASVLVLNPRKGATVEARWFYDKQGNGGYNLIDRSEVSFPQRSPQRYVAMKLTATTVFPVGAYKLQIFLDGNLAEERSFRIES